MKKIYILIFSIIFFNAAHAQTKDWILPVKGDPSLTRQANWYTNAFSTQNYAIGHTRIYMKKQELDIYDGNKWTKLVTDSVLTDIINLDEQNDSIVLICSQKQYGDLILFYNGKKWAPLAKLDSMEGNHKSFKRMGIQDVKFYHHKLYGIFLNTDIKSTLIEYDFKSNSVRSIATFQQNLNDSNKFYFQQSKMTLYIQNDRLYLAGVYDSVNHVPSQGFGYYDGKKFVNRQIFPTTKLINMSVVKRLDDSLFVVWRPNLDGANNLSELYLMKGDNIISNITANLFTQYRPNIGATSIAQSNLQVIKLNGRIIFMDDYSANYGSYEYDVIKNEWNVTGLSVNYPNAIWYKKQHYLFGDRITLPYPTKGSCFVVKPSFYISGYAYIDNDTNCIKSQADSVRRKEWVTLKGDSTDFSILTRNDGSYEIPVTLGKFWFEGNEKNFSTSLCKRDTFRIDSAINYNRNVSYSFVPPFYNKGDIDVSLSGTIPRRGRDYKLTILVRNLGKPALTVTPTLKFSKKLQYISSSSSVSSQGNGKIVFSGVNVSVFKPVKIVVTFHIHQDSLQVNDKIPLESYADSSNVEADYSNNIINYTETVQGPYDPNSISGNPENSVESSPAEIQYTVNFQNLGNDTAFNVKVIDTIPQQFDIGSIRILDHSGADLKASISKGVLEFLFTDIKLSPSSASDSGSKGFVHFALKLNDPMKTGQTVSNKVGIFFDYEAEVPTNKTSVTLVKPGSGLPKVIDVNRPFVLYPNPGNKYIMIKTSTAGTINNIRFYSGNGQEIYANHTGDNYFDISNWATGLFVVSVEMDGIKYNCLYSKIE